MRAHPLALCVFLLAACPGSRPPVRDQLGIPLPDFGPPSDADLGVPQGDILPADLRPESAPAQGTSCSASGVSFSLGAPLAPCGSIQVTVTAPVSYSWVLVGVTSASGSSKWSGGVSSASCNGSCTWTFPGVAVPCEAGPYLLSFMHDAVNDDPALGVIVASCTP